MRLYSNSLFIEFDEIEPLKGWIKKVEMTPVHFSDLNQLLVLLDGICNVENTLPQASMQLRTFTEKERLIEITKTEEKELAFTSNRIIQVIITMRQNASWQGFTVIDDKRMDFKSELEFIEIIKQYIENQREKVQKK